MVTLFDIGYRSAGWCERHVVRTYCLNWMPTLYFDRVTNSRRRYRDKITTTAEVEVFHMGV